MANASGLREGDTVVVTGAGQGIGRAIALDLARRGAALALWDVRPDTCADTAALCRDIGVRVSHEGVDVSDFAQVTAAAGRALEAHGKIFGLVSNAGVFPRATVLDATPDL